MILSRFIIYILILTSATFLYAQDEQASIQEKAIREEKLDTIFSTVSVEDYSLEEKQNFFKSIQLQLKDSYTLNPIDLSLIKKLLDKQHHLFPDERKSYIDLATYFDRMHQDDKVFEYSKISLEKDNIIYKDPENRFIASAYTYIGRYYLENKEYKQAYEVLSKAIIEKTSLVTPFYYMGNTCFQLKKYRECQNNYTYAFTRDISQAYPIDYFFFGIALHKNGFTDKAKDMLGVGCIQYPNEQGMHLNLAYIYREQDKLIEAYLEFYTEQILFGTESAFYQTAEVNLKNTEGLIGLRKDDREINTLKNLIAWEIDFNKNDYQKALTDIQNAKQSFEKYNFALYFLEYLTYFYIGNYEQALEKIEYIQDKTKNVAITYISKYETLVKLGKTKEAKENFDIAINLDPNNWKVHQILNASKHATGQQNKVNEIK